MTSPLPTPRMVIGSMSDIIRTVDEHAQVLNLRWGFNRLPHLVPIEDTERFKRQQHKWQLACFECVGDARPEALDRVRRHGEAMLRAYAKLDELARAAGHEPADPRHIQFELRDGTTVIVVPDRAAMGQVDRPDGGQVWCFEELADIIARFPDLVLVKNEFPQAEIVQLRTPAAVRDKLNDELSDIPFA
jgi:hypothetical protein